jgi:hypothetical protein
VVLKRHIRPALERLGVKKRIGWQSFRHGLSDPLRQVGVEIKTAEELFRYANSRITLDIYQQSLSEEKHTGAALAIQGLFQEGLSPHPSAVICK